MDHNEKIKQGNKFFLFVMIYMLLAPFSAIFFYEILYMFIKPNLITDLVSSTLFVIFIPTLIYFFIYKKDVRDIIQIKKVSIKNLILITLICVFIQPFMSFLAAFGLLFSENYVNQVAADLTAYPYILSLIAIALTPAIFEELLMRGVVSKNYEDLSIKKIALINGLFFGMIHGNLEQFFYAALLGMIFIYFYKLTGSILASIYAHFLINGSQITLAYFIPPTTENVNIDFSYLCVSFLLSIPFIIITILLMKMFIINNKDIYNALCKKENIKIIDKNFVVICFIFLIELLINYIY